MSLDKTINIDNFTFDSEIKPEANQASIKIETDSIDDTPSSLDSSLNKFVKKEVKFSPECESCEKTFVSKSALALHFTAVHLNQKPFECDKCKKAFSYKGGLKRHGCS